MYYTANFQYRRKNPRLKQNLSLLEQYDLQQTRLNRTNLSQKARDAAHERLSEVDYLIRNNPEYAAEQYRMRKLRNPELDDSRIRAYAKEYGDRLNNQAWALGTPREVNPFVVSRRRDFEETRIAKLNAIQRQQTRRSNKLLDRLQQPGLSNEQKLRLYRLRNESEKRAETNISRNEHSLGNTISINNLQARKTALVVNPFERDKLNIIRHKRFMAERNNDEYNKKISKLNKIYNNADGTGESLADVAAQEINRRRNYPDSIDIGNTPPSNINSRPESSTRPSPSQSQSPSPSPSPNSGSSSNPSPNSRKSSKQYETIPSTPFIVGGTALVGGLGAAGILLDDTNKDKDKDKQAKLSFYSKMATFNMRRRAGEKTSYKELCQNIKERRLNKNA